jgi:hypothetical protein
LRVTHAMEEGVTDHLWSLEDIAGLAGNSDQVSKFTANIVRENQALKYNTKCYSING